jgi:hypothetical protein
LWSTEDEPGEDWQVDACEFVDGLMVDLAFLEQKFSNVGKVHAGELHGVVGVVGVIF